MEKTFGFGPLVSPAAQWLLSEEGKASSDALLSGLVERLVASGFPLWRVSLSLLTLHPEIFAMNVSWQRGQGVESALRSHAILESPLYVGSPVEAIRKGGGPLHLRLDLPEAQQPFKLLGDLGKQGGKDYLALPLVFSDGRRSFVSFSTDKNEGFTPEQIEALTELATLISVRTEVQCVTFASRSLLEVYLGKNASTRVLSGDFKRGTGQSIAAAIWFCDLRGFTALGDRLPPRELVRLLDRYFEAVSNPIADNGGEILKFIGDAVLAIFPVDANGPRDPCRRALAAAQGALKALGELNAAREGEPPLSIGVALHLGEVLYGNIGARDRLDFTVIGAAVNEACRVESLCKELGAPLLLTSQFAAAAQLESARSLGNHSLKGVSGQREIFTPA